LHYVLHAFAIRRVPGNKTEKDAEYYLGVNVNALIDGFLFPFLPIRLLPLPLVQLGGLGSTVSSRRWVRDRDPAANAFVSILTPENTSGDTRISNPAQWSSTQAKFFASWGASPINRLEGATAGLAPGSATGPMILTFDLST